MNKNFFVAVLTLRAKLLYIIIIEKKNLPHRKSDKLTGGVKDGRLLGGISS